VDPLRIEIIDDQTVEMLRRLSPARRWEIANEMALQCRRLMASAVRSQHPAWPDAAVVEEVRRRLTHGAA
jgi:hypothetical protein